MNNSFSGITFPNAKINLGLRILNRRKDGFHSIETILYPISLYDALEWRVAKKFSLTSYGLPIPFNGEKNLIEKAYEALGKRFSIPPLQIQLLKNIPPGAGLGGGSSDALFFMQSINRFFQLGLTGEEMKSVALEIGSDCPFFVHNQPAVATGIGEKLKEYGYFLKDYGLILVYAGFPVSTKWAYHQVVPSGNRIPIEEIVKRPPQQWKGKVVNDFEPVVFGRFPKLKLIKEKLYEHNALYASMTGSGSAVYGIFKDVTQLPMRKLFEDCLVWSGRL